MTPLRTTICAALLCIVPVAASAVAKDTSFRDAQGHRVQQLELIVNAPVAKVWAAFTTDAGFESWAAPVAHVTLGNDGMIEASYNPGPKIGDADNIRNRMPGRQRRKPRSASPPPRNDDGHAIDRRRQVFNIAPPRERRIHGGEFMIDARYCSVP